MSPDDLSRSAGYSKNDASLWCWLLVNTQRSAPCRKERETPKIQRFLTLLSKFFHFLEIATTDINKNANQTKIFKRLWHLKTLPHGAGRVSCPSSDKQSDSLSVYMTDGAASHSRAQVVPHQPSHWLLRARGGQGLFSGLLGMPQMGGRGVSGVWWPHTHEITSTHSRR